MSILEKLTEGITSRSMRKEGAALLNKWQKTGLLEGLKSERSKGNMARLLENQAKELLREATTMQAGDVEGFAAVAFPIVRRVFGTLIAEDLVSVQPMSLPSGLIFFLDFTFENSKPHAGAENAESLYGGGVVAKGLVDGVNLTDAGGGEKGFYNLNNGYASPSASVNQLYNASLSDGKWVYDNWTSSSNATPKVGTAIGAGDQGDVRYDPDVLADADAYYVRLKVQLSAANLAKVNIKNLIAMDLTGSTGAEMSGSTVVRRLTTFEKDGTSGVFYFVLRNSTNTFPATTGTTLSVRYSHVDALTTSTALGSIKGTDEWYLEGLYGTSQDIPEINIKIDSVAIQAITKKLRAKWTPELGQDLDAYHNLDAEVELTSILSEQIALEIDQEILNDLVKGATAGTYYWSRLPGKFVARTSGVPVELAATAGYPEFTGTVSQWYETLIETINDASAQIHRKTLRGGANFVVCSPEVANILEFTSGFRASTTADENKGTIGAVSVGSLNKKWEVFVDPYFPRNVILIGRKGSGFLESGFVYAPYVPLQVTPTIFGVEDFTPRKGVMVRYGKKLVRPDYYAICIVTDLLGGAAAY